MSSWFVIVSWTSVKENEFRRHRPLIWRISGGRQRQVKGELSTVVWPSGHPDWGSAARAETAWPLAAGAVKYGAWGARAIEHEHIMNSDQTRQPVKGRHRRFKNSSYSANEPT